ncbi:Hypothetical protein PBC10988_22330 [Planctomycetales bacterium 10988]|nr:Hypothetical protein PBC10988_22330 [Planctomycetales bacterium 10988]
MNVRTFLAVDVDDAIRKKAMKLIDHLRDTPAKVRWVRPETIHLTLQFLGDVPIQDIAKISRLVAEATETMDAFPIDFQGVGAFPTPDKPRTVWAGVSQGIEPLRELHQKIQTKLEPLNFRPDRRQFIPHLTIGRVLKTTVGLDALANEIQANQDFALGSILADEVVIFSSELSPQGPIYEVLGRAPLNL